jgi:hypothetical protein
MTYQRDPNVIFFLFLRHSTSRSLSEVYILVSDKYQIIGSYQYQILVLDKYQNIGSNQY